MDGPGPHPPARRPRPAGPGPALTLRPGPGSSAGSSPAPALSAASPARRWGGRPTLHLSLSLHLHLSLSLSLPRTLLPRTPRTLRAAPLRADPRRAHAVAHVTPLTRPPGLHSLRMAAYTKAMSTSRDDRPTDRAPPTDRAACPTSRPDHGTTLRRHLRRALVGTLPAVVAVTGLSAHAAAGVGDARSTAPCRARITRR